MHGARPACLVAFLLSVALSGCTGLFDDEEKCGDKATAQRDHAFSDGKASSDRQSWELLLEDVCGREHHSAKFRVAVTLTGDADCDEAELLVIGKAYTGLGLSPYQGQGTYREGSSSGDTDYYDGTVEDIGYGQQADTAGAKTLLFVVEASYPSDDPATAERCLSDLVQTVHMEVSYSKPLAAA